MNFTNNIISAKESTQPSIGDWAKNTCSIIDSAHGGCPSCNKGGDIAILPIRYSAIHKNIIGNYSLPINEIESFTDIVPPESSLVGYVYRKLRKGFLYVYDDHPAMPVWHCFMISERGELTEFPISKKVVIEDIKNIKCNKEACAAWSSLVSLRDSNTARDVYFVYVEVPYSKKWLDKLSKDKNKRKSVMQFFRVGNIDKCKEVVDLKKVKTFVPEYNKYTDPRSLLVDQLYQGRFSSSDNVEDYIGNQDTFDNMYSYAVQAKGCGSRLSFALIIHDYIGMIEQLNYLRYEPFEKFQKNILPGNEGDELDDKKSPGKVLNESNYKWYLSISQLKKVMESFPVRDFNIDKNFVPDFDKPHSSAEANGGDPYEKSKERLEAKDKKIKYEQVRILSQNEKINEYDDLKEKYQKELNASSSDEVSSIRNKYYSLAIKKPRPIQAAHWPITSGWQNVEDYYKDQWYSCFYKEKENRDNAVEDFNSCYNENAYNNIGKLVDGYKKCIDVDGQEFDNYYSKWAINYISKSIAAFDSDDFWHGLRRSQVILEMLLHGILGEASAKLWSWFENSAEGHEITALCYSGGDSGIYDLIKKLYGFDFSNKQLDANEVESNSKDFWDKVKDLSEKMGDAWDTHRKTNYKTLWFENEMKDYLRSVKAFNLLKGSSNAALFMKEIAPLIKNGDAVAINFRKENRQMALEKLGQQIDQIDPDFKGRIGDKIKYFSIDISGNEVHAISRRMTDAALGKSSQIINRASQKFDSHGKTGGSFSSLKKFTGPKMKLYFAASEENAKKIIRMWDEAVKNRANAVDVLVQACKDTVEDGRIRSQGKLKGNHFLFATGLLGIWSVRGSLNKFMKEKNFDNFWSLTSDSLSLMQNACQYMELRVARRSIKVTPTKFSVNSEGVLASSKWSLAEKSLGHVVAIMAIYDFMTGMAEIDEMRAKGERSSFIMSKTIEVSAALVSAFIIGILITSVIGGIVVALFELAFIQFFKKGHYAPENVVNWTRRSKFGVEGETAPGFKFKNMEEEQNAIGMIWKGVIVSLEIQHNVLQTIEVEKEAGGLMYGTKRKETEPLVVEKTINYKISCPMGSCFVFRLVRRLESRPDEGCWIHISKAKDGVIVYPMYRGEDSNSIKINNNELSNRYVVLENGFVLVKDYYGRDNKILVSSETMMEKVSVDLLPAIEYDKEQESTVKEVKIKFQEKINKNRNTNGNELELEVAIWDKEEFYTDTYRSVVLFNNSRVV